jgi:putative tryptophan/tyrosine transport system substrate-binding protein
MNRREFSALVAGAAGPFAGAAGPFFLTLSPSSGSSETRPKLAVIALLSTGSRIASDRFYAGLSQGLQELGYLKGRDYELVERYADGDRGLLPPLAGEIVRLSPDIILAATTPATLAAREATATIPIVGINMNDPVGMGLVTSEARPGTNVTGILVRIEGQSAKQLEIAIDAIPGGHKVGLLFNPTNESNLRQRQETEAAAARLGLSLVVADARAAPDIGPAFKTFLSEDTNVVVVLGDGTFVSLRRQIAAFALAMHLPTVFTFREHVDDGGLISYGVNIRENYRRAAYVVDRILKGDKPAELPIEFPVKLELVINVATAKALGLEIPPTLLARADEVIE